MKVAGQKVVAIRYTLKGDGGEVLDASVDGEPLVYLHGFGNIIPGLEAALEGKSAGDKVSVTVTPEQGYGLRDEGLVQSVARSAFPGVDELAPGMRFQAGGPQGTRVVVITQVAKDLVTVDANHPLAGQTLHFEVELATVRDATREELEHGHVHGAGGHHHH